MSIQNIRRSVLIVAGAAALAVAGLLAGRLAAGVLPGTGPGSRPTRLRADRGHPRPDRRPEVARQGDPEVPRRRDRRRSCKAAAQARRALHDAIARPADRRGGDPGPRARPRPRARRRRRPLRPDPRRDRADPDGRPARAPREAPREDAAPGRPDRQVVPRVPGIRGALRMAEPPGAAPDRSAGGETRRSRTLVDRACRGDEEAFAAAGAPGGPVGHRRRPPRHAGCGAGGGRGPGGVPAGVPRAPALPARVELHGVGAHDRASTRRSTCSGAAGRNRPCTIAPPARGGGETHGGPRTCCAARSPRCRRSTARSCSRGRWREFRTRRSPIAST